jgi:plastocyanin
MIPMKLLAVFAVAVVTGILVTVGAAHLGGSGTAAASDRIVLELNDNGWSRNLAVHPGVPVTVTIINRSGSVHAFYAPELGVNQVIAMGTREHPSSTTFTFTASKAGVFEWHCYVPCGERMAGMVYAPTGLKFNAGWVYAT